MAGFALKPLSLEPDREEPSAQLVSLIDILLPLLVAVGAGGAGAIGHFYGGLPGGAVGACVGALLGWLLWKAVCAALARVPDRRSTEELNAIIEAGDWQVAASALRELSKRGEDISAGLPLVRSMLLSDNEYVRAVAYSVVTELYPTEAELLGDYDPKSPSQEAQARLRAGSRS